MAFKAKNCFVTCSFKLNAWGKMTTAGIFAKLDPGSRPEVFLLLKVLAFFEKADGEEREKSLR